MCFGLALHYILNGDDMTRDELKKIDVGDVIYVGAYSFYRITKLYPNGVQYREAWKNAMGTFSQLKLVTHEELLMPYWRVMKDE